MTKSREMGGQIPEKKDDIPDIEFNERVNEIEERYSEIAKFFISLGFSYDYLNNVKQSIKQDIDYWRKHGIMSKKEILSRLQSDLEMYEEWAKRCQKTKENPPLCNECKENKAAMTVLYFDLVDAWVSNKTDLCKNCLVPESTDVEEQKNYRAIKHFPLGSEEKDYWITHGPPW